MTGIILSYIFYCFIAFIVIFLYEQLEWWRDDDGDDIDDDDGRNLLLVKFTSSA